MSNLEKRNYPRAEVRWPVVIQYSRGSMDGVIQNVSFGGALISCSEPFRPDKVIEVVVNVPDLSKPLKLTAEVVRPTIHDHDKEISSKEIGVQIKFKTGF